MKYLFGKRVKYKCPKSGEEKTGMVVGRDPRPYQKKDGDWLVISPDEDKSETVTVEDIIDVIG